MFEELKGKRLLLLGGQGMMRQLTEEANKLGIYTIVTDYHTDSSLSPGKEVAAECWNISWNDIDALEAKCVERHVDGVFAAFSEFRVRAAILLCNRMGFPFYASLEQIDLTRDKARFKELCRESGVAVVDSYKLSAFPTRDELSSISYPVVIKPTDNAGSRGISVCYDDKELFRGIKKALSYSESKTFIAERYMDCPEVNASYTIQDGKITLSCVSDAIPGNQQHGQIKLTDGWLFPSRYLQAFIERCDAGLRCMIRNAGIQNGFLFVTVFFDNPEFRAFEMGFRLGGGTTYNFIAYNNEINYMQMMLSHSLTGKMTGWNAEAYDNPAFKKPCCNMTVMARPGIVGHVGNISALRAMDGVLSVDQLYRVSQEIPDSGALSQTFARVNLVAEDAAQLAERIQKTYEIIDLRDAEGKEMLLSRLDRDKITHYWEAI